MRSLTQPSDPDPYIGHTRVKPYRLSGIFSAACLSSSSLSGFPVPQPSPQITRIHVSWYSVQPRGRSLGQVRAPAPWPRYQMQSGPGPFYQIPRGIQLIDERPAWVEVAAGRGERHLHVILLVSVRQAASPSPARHDECLDWSRLFQQTTTLICRRLQLQLHAGTTLASAAVCTRLVPYCTPYLGGPLPPAWHLRSISAGYTSCASVAVLFRLSARHI